MKIGFIGAGRVGCSLGKYISVNGLELAGYYSQSFESAHEAAVFTNSNQYDTIEQIVSVSDVLLLTVPDGAIEPVWNEVKKHSLKNKLICHCSGVLSSDIFSDIDQKEAFGYSIHPLFAVNSRYHSYKEMKNVYFTIEGHDKYLDNIEAFFHLAGNPVIRLAKKQKEKYHTAASLASNYVISVLSFATDLLEECGFSYEVACQALLPMFLSNSQGIKNLGMIDALTGPLERADLSTIEKHISCLSGDKKMLYLLLAKQLLKTAKLKNPTRDYHAIGEKINRELEGSILSEKEGISL